MKVSVLKNYWWVLILVFIFLFSYYIRAISNVPDKILSFDPIMQYRFTKYVVDWGHMPVWDELTYYVGRVSDVNLNPPLMYYMTSLAFALLSGFGYSLLTVCAIMGAVYGALITISAFLLGKELSNMYGGLMSAILIGTAPQILIRTFGSSYDTDQLVLFFILLTTYLGIVALKRRNLASFSLALIGFTAFMLTWGMFAYTFFLLMGFAIINLVLSFIYIFFKKENKKADFNLYKGIEDSLSSILVLVGLFVAILIIGYALGVNVLSAFSNVIGFAQNAEAWIVNISIAELQPFNVFSLEGWITAMGRFITGQSIIDTALLIIFVSSLIFGIVFSFKKNKNNAAFVLTLFLLGTYTTFRGIRFTEFSSAIFIVLISVGFGYLIEVLSKKDLLLKSFSIGLVICIAFIAMNLGQNISTSLGPDISPNWDSAWEFLRTKTPELSIVGTWWDPGHMIAGTAERRNFADGAHCPNDCKYTINDRITDLGLIMATTDENVSLNLIRKYQGDSPKVYWIASDDLIGKYQWLQYFGTGCDARESNSNCPLYMQMPENPQMRLVDNNGNLAFRTYPLGEQVSIMLYNGQVPIPIYIQGINAVLFDEVIAYNGTQPITIKFNETERESIITALKPLERSLNVRFANQTIPMTVWVPSHYSYIVLIPPNLRNTVFTRMFMLEGQGLDHFKQVFRNEQVKIYEVI